MNKKNIVLFALCAALSGFQNGCSEKKTASNPSTETKQVESQKNEVAAPPAQNAIVCVWDGVPVRETPEKNGKFLSSLNLGEVITDLNELKIDASDKNREYVKVRLSDGKEGWALTYGLIKNAFVAVVKTNVTMCKRPDLLTITAVTLKPMDFVAVSNTIDDWIEITSDQKKKTGWIKKDAITTSKEDITMSILINKSLTVKDGKSIIEKYKSLIAASPFPNSIFTNLLKQQLDTMEGTQPVVASSVSKSSQESNFSDSVVTE
jgi:hypothetical protein